MFQIINHLYAPGLDPRGAFLLSVLRANSVYAPLSVRKMLADLETGVRHQARPRPFVYRRLGTGTNNPETVAEVFPLSRKEAIPDASRL